MYRRGVIDENIYANSRFQEPKKGATGKAMISFASPAISNYENEPTVYTEPPTTTRTINEQFDTCTLSLHEKDYVVKILTAVSISEGVLILALVVMLAALMMKR